ncbi:MAG: flavin reductase family protein [Arenibacterium sp.]
MAEEAFQPTPENRAAYRAALGGFATGVTVVTAMTETGPLAMTANSFVSVSLEPPVMLWCPAKSSQRHDVFTRTSTFMVHVMASDQQGLASHFARTGHDFSITDWQESDAGLPVLPGCLARFQCGLRAVHDGGDHSIVLGDVQKVWSRAGEGLIFKRGRYGGFAGLE